MKTIGWITIASCCLTLAACNKDDNDMPATQAKTITVQNVLKAKSLVESGTFQETGASPLIMPGQSITIKFSASIGQTLSFACMYGWSNDLFFAPGNPGIKLYDDKMQPIEGDVSGMIKLWDNGTRINQVPGSAVNHPGMADSQPVSEVNGSDAQGHTFLPASSLVKGTLKYDGDSYFTLTLKNISGGTANETPLSPGVWAVSYIAGGTLLNAAPLYTSGQPTAHGLTALSEMGDNSKLDAYVKDNTGTFTPLSPILVVVYHGIDNPIFKTGENDPGNGLKNLAQKGDASMLQKYLQGLKGVSNVYVLPAAQTTVLLPMAGTQPGSTVSQELKVAQGDKIAIATMYGFSNDWFFAATDIDAMQTGDLSGSVKLYNDGTAVDQFPGAGNAQFNLGGNTTLENKPIQEVPNPNAFTTLPPIDQIVKVTLQ